MTEKQKLDILLDEFAVNVLRKHGEKGKGFTLSDLIIQAYEQDLSERDKKEKSMLTSRLLKAEFITRCALSNCMKASFKLNKQATLILCRYGYLAEKGNISFSIMPLDRDTFLIKCKLDTSLMNNAEITYYNLQYDLNLPLNEQIESNPDDIDRYDLPQLQNNIIKLH